MPCHTSYLLCTLSHPTIVSHYPNVPVTLHTHNPTPPAPYPYPSLPTPPSSPYPLTFPPQPNPYPMNCSLTNSTYSLLHPFLCYLNLHPSTPSLHTSPFHYTPILYTASQPFPLPQPIPNTPILLSYPYTPLPLPTFHTLLPTLPHHILSPNIIP